MDLNSIYATYLHYAGAIAPVVAVIGFLIDKGPTLHRIASVLRWAADVLDRAPKVAGDLKAGDIPLAIKDAQDDTPMAHL